MWGSASSTDTLLDEVYPFRNILIILVLLSRYTGLSVFSLNGLSKTFGSRGDSPGPRGRAYRECLPSLLARYWSHCVGRA